MLTVIDVLYNDNRMVVEHLSAAREISLATTVSESFRKALVLAAASYFESLIQDAIVSVVSECAGAADAIWEFVKNKAIERQYHTYFDWKRNNANKFFGLFGSGFKEFMGSRVHESKELAASIEAFLELGNIRNQLVHQNFAVFPLQKTADEIYMIYETALLFVDSFPNELRKYCEERRRGEEGENAQS